LEVVRACEQVIGESIRYDVVEPRPGDPAILIATPEKIVRELAWSPRFLRIEQIVETAWQWHRRHPQGYDRSRH
jgi:UDP-glucose 4-epimerase